MTTLNLRLLGRPSITLNHEPLTNFVSEKAISLLCYLVANQKLHPRETLAGLFWSNLPEDRAKANLRLALHNINSLCPGYFDINRKTVQFLSNQPHWLDLDRFSDLIQSAEIDQLQTAVALYRDRFMHGISLGDSPEFEHWVGSMSEFYRRKQIDGLQTITDHFISQEDWHQASDSLVQLLQLEPWNENGHRQLMRSYAYQRKFDSALKQFQICQETLWQELEVEPTAETLDLAQRIRKARQTPKHNIRPPDAPFVGRQKDRATISQLLKTNKLITIAGLGGMGKTRLAMQVGLENADRFLNGVLFVPLANVSPEQNGQQAIASAILQAALNSGQYQTTLPATQSPEKSCIEFLHQRELLLILDNFEHLTTYASLISTLQQQLPNLTILVTSRWLLNLRGETVFRLDGLNSADSISDSAALFHQFAQLSGATLSDSDEESILEICQLVSGHPLAIELAADLTPFQSCQQIIKQLEARIENLNSQNIDQTDRQKSIGAVFETSWDASTKLEQNVLANLSWFQGTFSFEAAEAIAQATPAIMRRLGQKSLVNFQDARYQLHPLLRQFLLTKHDDDGRLAREAATYFLELLASLGNQSSRFGPIRIEEKLRLNLENFSTAWRWAIEHDIHLLTPIVHHMQSLLSDRGTHLLAQNLVDLALPAAEQTDNQSLIHGLRLQRVYHLFWSSKKHDKAFQLLEQVKLEINSADQTPGHAYFHLLSGWYFQYQLGEMDQAAAHYSQSKDIYTSLSFHKQALGRWLDLGNIAFAKGNLDEAESAWLAGLRLSDEYKIVLGDALLKFSLSQIELKRNNWVGAKSYLLEAQKLSQHHIGLENAVLGGLGEVAVFNQNFEQAFGYFQAQLELVQQQGQLHEIAAVHCNLGRLHLTNNRPDEAQHQFRQATHLAKIYENPVVLTTIEEELKKGPFRIQSDEL
ncbi:MAG: BTAD domain-containing putative transcriptional regulator [Anaerolineae bacterium]